MVLGIGDFVECTLTNTAKPATLAIDKQVGNWVDVNGNGLKDAGDTLDYTFVVTNTGELPMQGIAVNDPKVGPVSCPSDTLAIGASQTCGPVTYTIGDADMTAGAVKNSATASGVPDGTTLTVTSPPSHTSTPTDGPAPAITLTKSADAPTLDGHHAGDKVTYHFVATNTGNVPLSNVAVVEGRFTGAGVRPVLDCPGSTTLAPGEQLICTAVYTLVQADIDGATTNPLTNTATAKGTPPDTDTPVESPEATVTLPFTVAPSLSIDKSVTPSDPAAAGQTVTYQFLVTNTGNVTLSDVGVDETSFSGDGALGTITCPEMTLVPGQQTVCTAPYTLTQIDVDAGTVTNSAKAHGTAPEATEPTESDPDDATLTIAPAPALTLTKTASPTTASRAGQTITYTFAVTNSGNVTMSGIGIVESQFSGTGTMTDPSCAATMLPPGEKTTCTATYDLTQADVDAGTVTNTAYAQGLAPRATAPTPSNTDSPQVTMPSSPSIEVVKSASPTEISASGQEVNYSFTVTNTGNVTLSVVSINEVTFTGEGTMTAATCPGGASALAPTASIVCTAEYTTTQADIASGRIENTATAQGWAPGAGSPTVSDEADAVVTTAAVPLLDLVKSVDPTTVTTAGDTVTYSFVVTNEGNVNMHDIAITEEHFSGTGTLAHPTCRATMLAPGAFTTCTTTYQMTQDDIDAGRVTNIAVAAGLAPGATTQTLSLPANAEVLAHPGPMLTLVKTVEPTLVAHVGDTVTYRFQVANTGNVTLNGIGIDESAFSGTGAMTAVSCPSSSLAPNAQEICTARYAATQDDIDAGIVTNTATAHGTAQGASEPTDSEPSSAQFAAAPAPALTTTKSADPSDAAHFVPGQVITYSFVVRNSGNVTLSNVTANDIEFSGSRPLGPIDCPATPTLAPGAFVTCTAEYTITQADVDAGTLSNTATGTGTPPAEDTPITSPPDSVELPAIQQPALTLEKTATPTVMGAVGGQVVYQFLVTNSGNVTITDAGIDDTEFSGSASLPPISCPDEAESLAPGESVVCTTTYTVTQEDLDALAITNTAVATGTSPTGPVTSPPSSAEVTSDAQGKIQITKSVIGKDVNGDGVFSVGDHADWVIVVTNVGPITITNIFVADPTAGKVTCPANTLAPGAQMTCSVPTATITQQDVDKGKIANTATVTGSASGTTLHDAASAQLPVTAVSHAGGGPATGNNLGSTGSDIIGPLLLGGILLFGGTVLVLLKRRRRSN